MEFNKVTWYSKLIALIIFVSLPFLGFYLGMQLQAAIDYSNQAASANYSGY